MCDDRLGEIKIIARTLEISEEEVKKILKKLCKLNYTDSDNQTTFEGKTFLETNKISKEILDKII